MWRARDTRLDRPVAIKRLRSHVLDDPEVGVRFAREARAAAALSHPGIVTIYDTGTDPGGPWFAMELVDGETVAAKLARSDRLEVNATVSLGIQVARALHHAHSSGLVHRDIKPGNIMIRSDGRAQLVDFGITAGFHDVRLTQTGMVMGSLSYLAPEVAAGSPSTPQSDAYSLGVTLYEMLSGHPPFSGESVAEAVLAHQQQQPPPLPPEVPVWLQSVLMRCLEKRPEDRFGSAGLLAAALAEGSSGVGGAPVGAPGDTSALDPGGVGATRAIAVSTPPGVPPTGSESRKRWWMAWVAVLALVIFGVFSALTGGTPADLLDEATGTSLASANPVTTASVQVSAPVGAGSDDGAPVLERLIVLRDRIRTVVEISPLNSETANEIVEDVDAAVTAWQSDQIEVAQEHVEEALATAEEISVPLLRPLIEGFVRQLADLMGISLGG